MYNNNKEGNENNSIDYWNSARVKTMSTNNKWMDEVFEDATSLMELAKTDGVSDSLRLAYTTRAIDALTEIQEFLRDVKIKEEE